MAAGKLGKAGSSRGEVSSLSVSLASAATPGRTLVSDCTHDWTADLAVDGSNGWEIIAQEQAQSGTDRVTVARAILRRAFGDARDTCRWSIVAEDDAMAAVIVELDDDFGANGVAFRSVTAGPDALVRSITVGPLVAPADGIALAMVGSDEPDAWDASGSSGPFGRWTGSFAELSGGYFFGGDGTEIEDAGGGIAARTVRADESVSTTVTPGDGGTDTAVVAGILTVFYPATASVPAPPIVRRRAHHARTIRPRRY